MRRFLVAPIASLCLAAGLVTPAHAEDLSYGMWDNGVVGSSSYRQATFYTSYDGSQAYAEITGNIQTTWNLQELSASGSSYRYWKLHVDTKIKPTSTSADYIASNDDLWTRVTVWPKKAKALQKWTTESKNLADRSGCKTASVGVGQSLGPFNANLALADWSFCNRVMLTSTQNPQDIWRQHYVVRDFDKAKDFGVVYILKTRRHQMPRFHIDVDFPKDTGSGYDVTSRVGGYTKVTPKSGRY
jgi:hypothetical protein